MIELRTFDTVELTAGTDGNADALLSQPKRFALFCFLAIPNPGTMYRRDTLLGLFWPEGDSEHTRMALRQALARIRKVLGHDVIVRRGSEEVGLNPDLLWCDVGAFEHALDDCKWSEAIELYRGDLLKGLFVSQAPEFERWLETERARLAGRYGGALEELANAATAAGKTRAAVEWWQSLVLHDPFDSRYAIELMEALERAGDPANALLHARKHRELLREELEIAPSAGFEAAAQRIQDASAARPADHPSSGSISSDDEDIAEMRTEGRATARRVRRSKFVVAGVSGLLVLVVGIVLFSRGTRETLNLGPVVVAVFHNATGDPSLDQLGERTSHWITQGLQRAAIPVIPWDQARDLWDYAQDEVNAGRARDPMRLVAEDAGVGFMISGAVYLEGDSLEIQVDVTDAIMWRMVGTVGPVVGSRTATREIIAETQQRVMAFLAMRFDERRSDWDAADWAKMPVNPPTFEAWQTMQEAPILVVPSTPQQKLEVIEYYRRAAELDPTWVDPVLRSVTQFLHLGRAREADSVLTLVDGFGDRLTPFDRAKAQKLRARLVGDRDLWYRSVRRTADLSPYAGSTFNSALVSFKLMNKPAEAIEILESISEEHRFVHEQFAYWDIRISSHHNLGEYEEALDLAKRARALRPDRAERSLCRQLVELAAMGSADELLQALDELEEVTAEAVRPSYVLYEALIRSAEELRANGQRAAAGEFLDRAMGWFTSRRASVTALGMHRWWYAWALVLAGRHDDAQHIVEESVLEFQDGVGWRGFRGFLAAVRGDTAQALDDAHWLEQYVPTEPNLGGIGLGGDRRAYYRLAILGVLGEEEQVTELLADAHHWWDFETMSPQAVELEPIRDNAAFQELMRPKG